MNWRWNNIFKCTCHHHHHLQQAAPWSSSLSVRRRGVMNGRVLYSIYSYSIITALKVWTWWRCFYECTISTCDFFDAFRGGISSGAHAARFICYIIRYVSTRIIQLMCVHIEQFRFHPIEIANKRCECEAFEITPNHSVVCVDRILKCVLFTVYLFSNTFNISTILCCVYLYTFWCPCQCFCSV